MPDSRPSLSPEELATLLRELDAVMEEAASLRSQVTRQLVEHFENQQQLTSRTRKRPRARR